MKQHISKVAIIGAGLVGSSTAFSLLTQGLCDEILLVDRDAERAHGEMMDLRDGIDYLGRNIRVTVGGYAGCGDADIVVITAGRRPARARPGSTPSAYRKRSSARSSGRSWRRASQASSSSSPTRWTSSRRTSGSSPASPKAR